MCRIKNLARLSLNGAYKYSGLARLVETATHRAGKRFMVVLIFHRVTDQIPPDGLTVSTSRFRAICRLLKNSFRVVSVSEVARIVRERLPIPPRTVAITFDDCYRDNLDAARVLAEHGLTASFFIPPAFVGTDHVFPWDEPLPRMANLTWDEVREIAALGHEIGSHTTHHADLGAVSHEEARREIIESKKWLEEQVGRPVRWLAYPFGGVENFRPELLADIEEAGYEGCLSAFGGFITAGSDPRLLPREAVPYFDSVLHLELYVRGCLDWVYGIKRRLTGRERPQFSPYPPPKLLTAARERELTL
jgi:peptidoglycan/xylan/chitin deacetylase (PgdA/CDA1 family)